MRRALFLVVATACYGPAVQTGVTCANDGACPLGLVCSPATQTCEPEGVPADGPPRDGSADASTSELDADVADALVIDARVCFGSTLVSVCLDHAPPPMVELQAAINTDQQCAQVVPGTPELCVIAADELKVNLTVPVTGSRPLVLVGTSSITVTGALVVGSRRGSSPGAGARASCPGGTPPSAGSKTGGYGGSFSGTGGRGASPSGGGSLPPAAATQPVFVGGCPGATGGAGQDPVGAAGGAGGGAVALLAGTMIHVLGSINASGAGGSGCQQQCGGGGGGSGGIVVLEAPTVISAVGSQVFANGGGGAAGSDNSFSEHGRESPSAAIVGAGGSGGSGGGDGGAGSVGVNRTGGDGRMPDGGGTGRGGGGGGGSAGWIVVRSGLQGTGVFSPPVTP